MENANEIIKNYYKLTADMYLKGFISSEEIKEIQALIDICESAVCSYIKCIDK